MHLCKNYIAIFILIVGLTSIKADNGACGLNETPGCGSCDLTCAGILNDPSCASRCADFPCKCLPGFVRDPNGVCVPFESCPVLDVEPVCGVNQHYGCVNQDCILTCDDPVKTCLGDCSRKGCVCDQGFVLNTHTNECVLVDHCCGGNSTFAECGPMLPERCPWPPVKNNVRSKLMDIALHICGLNACVCNEGYVLNYKQECVRLEDCPAPLVCGKNEVEAASASNCPRTCENYMDRSFKCADQSRGRKCVCKKGFVLDALGGTCIPFDSCPAKETPLTLPPVNVPANLPVNGPSVPPSAPSVPLNAHSVPLNAPSVPLNAPSVPMNTPSILPPLKALFNRPMNRPVNKPLMKVIPRFVNRPSVKRVVNYRPKSTKFVRVQPSTVTSTSIRQRPAKRGNGRFATRKSQIICNRNLLPTRNICKKWPALLCLPKLCRPTPYVSRKYARRNRF